jgi:hypothetical protein
MPFCPKCGREITQPADYCPFCGTALRPSTVEKAESRAVRPFSITIASILFMIFGVLGFISSSTMLIGGAAITSVPLIGWLLGPIVLFVGIIGFIFSVLDIIAGVLLWDSKKSGGIIGIISCVSSFLVGLITLPLGLLDIVFPCL